MSETNSAIQSSDLRQKIVAPTANDTTLKTISLATQDTAQKLWEKPSSSSSRAFSTRRCGSQAHERAPVHGVRSRANSLGITELKTPTGRTATATHARRATSSRRPRKPVPCLCCSLAPSVTTPLYGATISQTLRQTLRASFSERSSVDLTKIELPIGQAMYACVHETECGFFEVACAPSNATAHFGDPPPPLSAKEPEPWQWGSSPMWITRRVTVGGALA